MRRIANVEVIIITIEKAATELAQVLKETEEYANLRAAQARIKLDPTAQSIIAELEQVQGRIQELHSQGLPVEEDIQKLVPVEQKALQNPTLSRLFQAQEQFGEVMKTADKIINKELADSE
ncbi:MAG: YlbF family regulator [Firmicutes bacterium]|nr:YlbF family regulator [Bacillota bacterium]